MGHIWLQVLFSVLFFLIYLDALSVVLQLSDGYDFCILFYSKQYYSHPCHHVTLASQNVCKLSSQLNSLSVLFPYEITIIFLHNMGLPNEQAKFD